MSGAGFVVRASGTIEAIKTFAKSDRYFWPEMSPTRRASVGVCRDLLAFGKALWRPLEFFPAPTYFYHLPVTEEHRQSGLSTRSIRSISRSLYDALVGFRIGAVRNDRIFVAIPILMESSSAQILHLS
jgi:hypothetical protein